jgi:hypothetical protein
MAQRWTAEMAGKFFCQQCGALYETLVARRSDAAGTLECLVCRTDMRPRTPEIARPYRLIQRPEAVSDY